MLFEVTFGIKHMMGRSLAGALQCECFRAWRCWSARQVLEARLSRSPPLVRCALGGVVCSVDPLRRAHEGHCGSLPATRCWRGIESLRRREPAASWLCWLTRGGVSPVSLLCSTTASRCLEVWDSRGVEQESLSARYRLRDQSLAAEDPIPRPHLSVGRDQEGRNSRAVRGVQGIPPGQT